MRLRLRDLRKIIAQESKRIQEAYDPDSVADRVQCRHCGKWFVDEISGAVVMEFAVCDECGGMERALEDYSRGSSE